MAAQVARFVANGWTDPEAIRLVADAAGKPVEAVERSVSGAKRPGRKKNIP
jgi:hypothetical protein